LSFRRAVTVGYDIHSVIVAESGCKNLHLDKGYFFTIIAGITL